MKNTPQNPPGRRIPRLLKIWLIVFLLIIIGFMSYGPLRNSFIPFRTASGYHLLALFVFGLLGASFFVGLLAFARWSCCWRNLRRTLVGVALVATLIAIFYAEEDWRGKRAWENYKRGMEAGGIVMDWEKLIPPPVPDDQNFFKASPDLERMFTKIPGEPKATNATAFGYALPDKLDFPILDTSKTGPIVVANVTVVSPEIVKSPAAQGATLFKASDPGVRAEASKLIRNTLGERIAGAQGFDFSAVQLDKLVALQIMVQADTPLSVQDLENLLSLETETNVGSLRIEAVEGNNASYHLLLTGVKITSAADYLKWIGQFEPFFDEIREALKRPFAQIDGDYSLPYKMPIPNFILMRTVAQTLAQRAQCYLLLGQPEEALRQLTLLHDSCRILQNAPTGRPLTLVAAMINTAIAGLYVNTVAECLRSHSWNESQLLALQAQLKSIDLPSVVKESLSDQAASSSRTLETFSSATLKRLFFKRDWSNSEYRMFFELNLMPRGWVYQNMIATANLEKRSLDTFNDTNHLISPQKLEQLSRETERTLAHISPWNLTPSEFIPNVYKATLTVANNQTLVNEAQVVCALERYHLAKGEYPETLAVLMPQFIEQLPHDIIGGQPLHYRRADDGKFLLYSVGWNEKDDGGVVDTTSHAGHDSREYGDWVWE